MGTVYGGMVSYGMCCNFYGVLSVIGSTSVRLEVFYTCTVQVFRIED